jgi:hypothetical protein
MHSLVANYRHRGWRWPLREGDQVEVFQDHELVGVIPVELLARILVNHLEGAALEAKLRREFHRQTVASKEGRPRPVLRGVNGRRLRGVKPT